MTNIFSKLKANYSNLNDQRTSQEIANIFEKKEEFFKEYLNLSLENCLLVKFFLNSYHKFYYSLF